MVIVCYSTQTGCVWVAWVGAPHARNSVLASFWRLATISSTFLKTLCFLTQWLPWWWLQCERTFGISESYYQQIFRLQYLSPPKCKLQFKHPRSSLHCKTEINLLVFRARKRCCYSWTSVAQPFEFWSLLLLETNRTMGDQINPPTSDPLYCIPHFGLYGASPERYFPTVVHFLVFLIVVLLAEVFMLITVIRRFRVAPTHTWNKFLHSVNAILLSPFEYVARLDCEL